MVSERTSISDEKAFSPGGNEKMDSQNLNQDENNTESTSPAMNTTNEAADREDYQKKHAELYEQYVRLAADFENYRRRYAQEQESLRKYGSETTARQLIPFIDNLERAANSLSENSDSKVLYQSFRLVYNQLMDALKDLGFKKIEAGGQSFDPQFHEAVTQIETDAHPENTVVNEMQSGYLLHDRVLRPALVAVSVPKSAAPEEAACNPFAHAKPVSGAQAGEDSVS